MSNEIVSQKEMTAIQLAVTNGSSPEVIRELMTLEREYKQAQAVEQFNLAMAEFSKIKKVIPADKKGQGPGGSSYKYASFPQLERHVSPWLAEYGLSFSHEQDDPVIGDNGQIKLIMVHCILKHASGHSIRVSFPAVPDLRLAGKESPSQTIQKAITYAKRQTLCMATGISSSEDAFCDDSTVVVQEKVKRKMGEKGSEVWKRAVAAYKRDGNFNTIEEHVELTEDQKKAIKAEANDA